MRTLTGQMYGTDTPWTQGGGSMFTGKLNVVHVMITICLRNMGESGCFALNLTV
jgi:hypothetical protein